MAPAASPPCRPRFVSLPQALTLQKNSPAPAPSLAPAMTSRSPGPVDRLQTAPRLQPSPLASPHPSLAWGEGELWPLCPKQ